MTGRAQHPWAGRRSPRHYRLLNNGGPDTPEQVAERLAHRRACDRLHAERIEKYPTITAANVDEVLAWQRARLEELKAEELAKGGAA